MKYMNGMKRWIVTLWVCCLCVSLVQADFSRYAVILERRPFGEAPDPEPEPPPRPTGPSYADELRLVAMTKRQGDIRVGLVDGNVSPARSYFLFVGDEEDGLRVVAADYDAETVMVERDGDQRTIRMGGGSASQDRSTAGPGMIAGRRRPGARPDSSEGERNRGRRAGRISEGRRQRMEEEQRRREHVPEITGAVLERHLQEYNVHAIREGMPPLPIPLTEEQDRQLVEEGVLPPRE